MIVSHLLFYFVSYVNQVKFISEITLLHARIPHDSFKVATDQTAGECLALLKCKHELNQIDMITVSQLVSSLPSKDIYYSVSYNLMAWGLEGMPVLLSLRRASLDYDHLEINEKTTLTLSQGTRGLDGISGRSLPYLFETLSQICINTTEIESQVSFLLAVEVNLMVESRIMYVACALVNVRLYL